MSFNWNTARETLTGFGGEKIKFHIPKTGLPFYDTLRLYGAIDLYIGLREDITISDKGNQWIVEGRTRIKNNGKDVAAFKLVKKRTTLNRADNTFVNSLRTAVFNNAIFPNDLIKRGAPLTNVNPDSSLQNGIRDIAATEYSKIQSGADNTVYLSLADAVFAFSGGKRVHSNGNILFLPLFDGKLDLGKIVSPIRIWSSVPSQLLISVLEILTLMTSLFVDEYEDRLSAVVFNTDYGSREKFNYSGLISIESTALKKANRGGMSKSTILKVSAAYRQLLNNAYKENKATGFFLPAYNTALWIINPVAKNLSSLITAQEMVYKEKGYFATLFFKPGILNENETKTVKDLFDMTYTNNSLATVDYEAVQKLAKAVASAIYYARQKDAKKEEKGKAWYDEIVMLRSAPTARVFKERALTLLEQGHKENPFVGTHHNEEDYNPAILLKFIGDDRQSFEMFRDLFRMYLIQESTWKNQEPEERENKISESKI